MSVLNDENLFFFGIGFGTIFLLPQVIHGYRSKSLKDVSTGTLICVVLSSSSMTVYLFLNSYKYYAYSCGFILLNSIFLLLMQFWQYYQRFKLHVKTFEPKQINKKSSSTEKRDQNLSHSVLHLLPQNNDQLKTNELEIEMIDTETNNKHV